MIQKATTVVKQWEAHVRLAIEWPTFQKQYHGTTLPNPYGMMDLIQYVDPFKCFRNHGASFPVISLLAREYFAKMDSSAVQERMFSAAEGAMSKKQTSMNADHHEKRVILHENRAFMDKH